MKKILFAFILIAALLLIPACSPDAADDGDYTPPAYTVLVRDLDSAVVLSDVVKEINLRSGRMLLISGEDREQVSGEIVFGDTDRSVSREATKRLKAQLGDVDGASGYLVYKDDSGDVAVVWSERYSMELAVSAFVAELCDLSALEALPAGTVCFETYDLDTRMYSDKWRDMEENAPAQLVNALKALYDCYDGSDIVDWMSGLWEPFICACGGCDPDSGDIACYGGAFYYSNSAREGESFLPDLESTCQLLSWMQNNGALEDYDSYSQAIPEGTAERIVAFCQACLDPDDGYFYHPQWGKSITTVRRGRDLSWGISILSSFDVEPQYLTAVDRLKRGVSASSLVMPLCGRGIGNFSSVIPAASFEDSLKSEESYLNWLKAVTNGDNMFYNSSGAHTINAVKNQIVAAGYLEVTLDYLDSQQDKLYNEMKAAYDADPENNPMPTGLWQRTIDYNAVWGLLKFTPFYTTGKREIRYAEYGIRTCIGVILIKGNDAGSYYANDMMNQWSAANLLINNAKTYNPSVVPKLYELTNERAVEMIENSMSKLKAFRCEDGSFSYTVDYALPEMYGSPTALGIKEGDVNATGLLCTMYRCCFTVLGYEPVPLCDWRDGERFIKALSESVK